MWQRDALRRLLLNGDLSTVDIDALTQICKSVHGLAPPQECVPLAKEHVPERIAGIQAVSLNSIFHHRGVNALAEGQTLRFGPQLTAVYGDNGAGKTGYIRILKNACRARQQEKILGNVVSGMAPPKPTVSIKYQVGSSDNAHEWNGTSEDPLVSRVSVFDTQCAAVYLTEKTDVAFRPFGLDLFDKLVQACKSVRSELEVEQRAIGASTLTALQSDIPQGTAAARLLTNISSLTNPEDVEALSLSAADEDRLAFLERSLIDSQANDPAKLLKQLEVRLERCQSLTRHLEHVEQTLSDDAVRALFDTRTQGKKTSDEARQLRERTFTTELLAGTGSESWTPLWEAARRFSEGSAYPGGSYPVVGGDARCVLCQQDIDHAAAHRLEQFEAFVTSTKERELRQFRETFSRLRKSFNDLTVGPESILDTLKELSIEHESAASTITASLGANEARRKAIILATAEDKDLAADCPALVLAAGQARAVTAQIDSRVTALRSNKLQDTRKLMVPEATDLRARKRLYAHRRAILDDIERRKRLAAYAQCIEETRSQSITQKSSAITKTAVSQELKQRFREELNKLSFSHIEVELVESGGAEGVFYHKLILTRAPGVDLPNVVSEGEQRCLSIAAFFAELSTADDPSGIVFDDPVSSLDYQWREAVAHRLVDESKSRQVIVFTHDVVFLLALRQFAEESGVQCRDQHVRYQANSAGVCSEELPWVALKINKKIGVLKKSWATADKLYRDGHQDAYEKDAKYLYGFLREAWERALEEVLLSGIVERYRPGVQTQQIARIADITLEDCSAVDKAMSKCSAKLRGHD